VNRTRAGEIALLAVIALFFLMAPTHGRIGCQTKAADDLDPTKFFAAKQDIDCQKCLDCEIHTQTCLAACGQIVAGTFPTDCFPNVRDGEVCLDALQATGCEGYGSFVADEGSTIPTECDFCPPMATK
jgi:hypothetical protein